MSYYPMESICYLFGIQNDAGVPPTLSYFFRSLRTIGKILSLTFLKHIIFSQCNQKQAPTRMQSPFNIMILQK